jgi:hypothetical protein
MKRIRVLGVVLVAVFAFGAVAIASAAKMPEFKPATNEGTSSSASATFTEEKEAFSIKCEKNTGTNAVESGTAGKFTETFNKCKAAGIETCTGEGQKSGVIVVKGTFMLGLIKLEESGAGIAFLIEPVKFECAGTKIEVTGCAAGPITPTETATTKFTVKLKATKGKQEPGEFESKACTLTSKKGSEAAREGGQEQTEEIVEKTSGEIT